MNAMIQKWGNSLALRIPRTIAAETHLGQGAVVTLAIRDGKMIIAPTSKRKYTLHSLLRGVSRANLHTAVDTGRAVGREVW